MVAPDAVEAAMITDVAPNMVEAAATAKWKSPVVVESVGMPA
jgi:hypothetical protein